MKTMTKKSWQWLSANVNKKYLKKSTLGAFALASTLLLTLAPAPQAYACGRGCGGGTTINGQTVDRYMNERRVKDRQDLIQFIAPRLERIRELDPALHSSILRDIEEMDWYKVDQRLDQLPFQRSRVPFAANQTCMQFDDNVVCNDDEFNGMKSDRDRGDMVLHEVFMRRFLRLEGVNPNLSPTSVWKAVDVLSDENLRSNPNLSEQLSLIGFTRSPLRQATTNPDIVQAADSEELMEIPLTLPASWVVTTENVQIAQNLCVANAAEALFDSIRGQRSVSPAIRMAITNLRSQHYFRFEDAPLSNLAPFSERNFSSMGPLRTSDESRIPSDFRGGINGMFFFFLPAGAETRQATGSIDRRESLLGLNLPHLRFSMGWDQGADEVVNGRMFTIGSLSPWPVLRYTFNPLDRTHLTMGNVNPNLGLREFKVVVPTTVFNDQNGMYTFVNARTGVATPVQVSGRDYVNCLQRELAARAQAVRGTSSSPAADPAGSSIQQLGR